MKATITEYLASVDVKELLPGAEPFLYEAEGPGCLLLHGFTSAPEEMRWLGDDLAQRGYTVLG